MQKIYDVKNTARGIVISSWRKKYLYSTYIFGVNNQSTIIEQWPLPHPLRSTVYMLTRISIPDDYMRRFFYRTEISEKEKCMFSGKSCDYFSSRSHPWDNAIFCTSITFIFSRKRKESENIVIYFFYESIFIDWTRTPVSPENDMRSWCYRVESISHAITGKYIWYDEAIRDFRDDPSLRKKKSKWRFVDTISCEKSLSSMVWSYKFFLWISPYSITWELTRKHRKRSNDVLLRNRFFRDRLDYHTKCCDLTGKFIFLESELIATRDIESSFSKCTQLETRINIKSVSHEWISLLENPFDEDMIFLCMKHPPEWYYGTYIFFE